MNKAAVILMVVLFTSGCANSNLDTAAVAGANQTFKTKKNLIKTTVTTALQKLKKKRLLMAP